MLAPRSLHQLFTAITLAAATLATAQENTLAPPPAMALANVPPVPSAVAARVAQYTEFKPTLLADWHPTRKELLVVRRHQNTAQLYRVAKPGAPLQLLTDYPEPVNGARFHPKHGKSFLFAKDAGGNEVYRGFVRAADGGEAVPVTPDGQRVQDIDWSNSGKQVVFVTVPVGRTGSNDQIASTLWIADPAKPQEARKVAELPGGGWSDFRFSPDDRQLVYVEYVSINESYVWLMDVATGKTRRILGKNGAETVSYGSVEFSKDGKGLYAVSDAGSEFARLTYYDLASLEPTVLTPAIDWDVSDIALSADNKLVAFTVNEDGTSVLRLLRIADRKLLPVPKLPLGTIAGLEFHDNSRDLALAITSATGPSDVYSLDVRSGTLTRWTRHEKMGVDASRFVEPEIVRWPSFDGRSISGFLYRAPKQAFPGKRPVVINIHGGPEGQSTAGFLARSNYFINEMGISIIYPNVRGSAGYGKSFLKLDNGALREDSVKDIGALLDWIAKQPDLDASRVAVMGGSYGGYMTLAVATNYPERIAAAVDVVGISSFVTFLEKTESYRRDLRRVEYGDERDPAMRKHLEAISPLNNAGKISKPLFVIQGKNDPRVPYHEADQIVATVKKNGTPVWYMMANDEGHGFRKKANADYQFYSTIAFLERYLVGK